VRLAAPGWKRFLFSGPDHKKFLHGQLTADVLSMKQGEERPALLLTPKGKLRGVLELLDLGDSVAVVADPKSAANLVEDLGKKILLSESTMKEVAGPVWRGEQGWGFGGEAGAPGLENWLTEAGRPLYGRDVDENTLPQEAGFDAALSFTKGCYMGQETVSRIHHLGHVNRKLVPLKLEGEPSSEVRITSRSKDRALGWVKAEKALPGTRLGGAVVL
jgi:folate-binding protein YgfZ